MFLAVLSDYHWLILTYREQVTALYLLIEITLAGDTPQRSRLAPAKGGSNSGVNPESDEGALLRIQTESNRKLTFFSIVDIDFVESLDEAARTNSAL